MTIRTVSPRLAVALPLILLVSSRAPAQEKDAEADGLSAEDVAVFSYWLGHREGTRLSQRVVSRDDKTEFMKGARSVLGPAAPKQDGEPTTSFEQGEQIGKAFRGLGKSRFKHLDTKQVLAGLDDAFAGNPSTHSKERIAKAQQACAQHIAKPTSHNAPNPMLGKPAPKWEVDQWHQLPEGVTGLDISDFKGKVLYIYCFQSWCPGCHKAGFPTLKAVSDKHKSDDEVRFVVFQTVFEDSRKKQVNTFNNLKAIARKYDLKMPFAQSGDINNRSKIMTAYRTRGTPWTMIVDRQGVIRYSSFRINKEEAGKLIEELKKTE